MKDLEDRDGEPPETILVSVSHPRVEEVVMNDTNTRGRGLLNDYLVKGLGKLSDNSIFKY